MPNNIELSGRAGDGRRGKSSGQMVGDTAKGLEGRKTPARVGDEKYEPGQLKNEGTQDPNGATGGGKKTGAGRKGLQGGIAARHGQGHAAAQRQAGRAARESRAGGPEARHARASPAPACTKALISMKSAENDLRDLRYDDAARKRKTALTRLHGIPGEIDQATAATLSRARDLPPHLRNELLQAADESYPPGYEALLKNYYKKLSQAEK